MVDHFSRRAFLRVGALGAAGALAYAAGVLRPHESGASSGRPVDPADLLGPFGGYGDPVSDPDGILDLPPDFSYRILTRTGDPMEGGATRPSVPDGMETYDAGDGRLALCINHEVRDPGRPADAALRRAGDRSDAGGGTTTLILAPDGGVETQFVSQSDTSTNCAGGRTPWGTWLTCEETEGPGYGYVYDVDPFTRDNGPRYPAMGRFFHEAVVFDPRTGIVYQTEDRSDGLLYRFIPEVRGDLTAGRLEAMAVQPPRGRGERLRVRWIDMTDVAQSTDALRWIGRQRGATPFAGCEGIAEFGGSIYFDEGHGGAAGLGRIWRLRPAQATLELFYESAARSDLQQPDNMRQQPGTGDLVYCEDRHGGTEANKLVVQSNEGALFTFARDRTGSEFAGACWHPAGDELYVNLQQAGLTLSVTGPFRRPLAAERARAVAGAAPTGGVRRADPDELARAARDRGMAPLEVEAALALGHDLG